MNALLTLFAAKGAIAGSELLFWLVVILVVAAIIYFLKAIL